jgi:AraC family transcriptional regulator
VTLTASGRFESPRQGGVRASLAYYAAGGAQPLHAHDFGQISFLLSGNIFEQLAGRECRPEVGDVGIKPPGAPHLDEWGPNGALVFSLLIDERQSDCQGAFTRCGWYRGPPDAPVAALVRAGLEPSSQLAADALDDLLALVEQVPFAHDRPPPWLGRVRESIIEEPTLTVEQQALRAGVHRGHLARVFQKQFGIPPSLFRRRALVARAVAKLSRREQSLSSIAHEVGFADHSHMSRIIAVETGLGPQRLRHLLADEVTSVQDTGPLQP